MPKKIFYLLIFLSLQLGIFVQPALAVSSCDDVGIDWNPRIFLENASDYTLTFTINNDNTFKNLENHTVRLKVDRFDIPIAGVPIFGWDSPSVNIGQNKTFDIQLTGEITKKGHHYAYLQWVATGKSDYEDYCSAVVYQVGSVGACTIVGTPEKIQSDTHLTVKFSGKANTEYRLNYFVSGKGGLGDSTLDKTTTDGGGTGTFRPVVIPGSNGDTVRLTVTPVLISPGDTSCSTWIKIDPQAPAPIPPPPGPVQPAPITPTAKQCPGAGETFDSTKHLDPAKCSSAGGESCENKNDGRGAAFKTAIGCIHTSPAEFVKDFLTFIIAISGGLAFLMMLLGAFGMLTSGGNPESLNAGRERLTSAIIGLLFVIFAILLMQIIGLDILKLPGFAR